jgi:ferredoxin-NADP reductase
MSPSNVTLSLRVKSITWETKNIHSIVLESLDEQALPAFSAGAHIDLTLKPNLSRSYSLIGDGGNSSCYVIAVAKDENSRGGSRYVHESLRVGDPVQVSQPRNNFPLIDTTSLSVLIAGGIGITPLWSMVQRLEALGRRWILHYFARARTNAAFLKDIEKLAQQSKTGKLIVHFDGGTNGKENNLSTFESIFVPEAHLYCCGPRSMLAAFEQATKLLPADHVHLEYFGTPENKTNVGFKVILAKSACEFEIPAHKSILDVLLDNDINVQYGCMQGSCGMCELGVLAGEPEHHDNILSADARASNSTMLICCSRSNSLSLTLDI